MGDAALDATGTRSILPSQRVMQCKRMGAPQPSRPAGGGVRTRSHVICCPPSEGENHHCSQRDACRTFIPSRQTDGAVVGANSSPIVDNIYKLLVRSLGRRPPELAETVQRGFPPTRLTATSTHHDPPCAVSSPPHWMPTAEIGKRRRPLCSRHAASWNPRGSSSLDSASR
jgi:hypothetical protein